MSVGLAATKAEIDSRVGDLARSFQRDFRQVTTLQTYLAATLDSELIALGYTQAEVNTLRSAVADMVQLNTLWTGAANLSVAKDFRAFIQRLWGVGAF